jgi:hypothetical protein
VNEIKDSFWGDLYGQTRLAWKKFWEGESTRERDSYMQSGWYDRVPSPNGTITGMGTTRAIM